MKITNAVLLTASAMVMISGCGKKGPLLYPDLLVAQPPQKLTVEQSGSTLRLGFDLPEKDLAGRRLDALEAVLLARRVSQNGDCVSCQDQYQELLKIDPAYPAPAQRQGNRISWTDRDVRVGERYQYRLQAVQKGGVTGSSATTAVTGLQPQPPAPRVKAQALFGGILVVELEGTPPEDMQLVGFRLYRADGPAAEFTLVATLSSTLRRFEDQAMQRETDYRYAARMLVRYSDGLVAESELSEEVSVRLADNPN